MRKRRLQCSLVPCLGIVVGLVSGCGRGDVGVEDTDSTGATESTGESTTDLTTNGPVTLPPVPTTSGEDETTTGTTVEDPTETPTTGTESSSSTTEDPTEAPTCVDPSSDCPAPPPCQLAVCDAEGQCSVEPVEAGVLLPGQVAGDCQIVVCDGAGGMTAQADDDDLPAGDGPCFAGTCQDGEPGQDPLPGAACGQRGDLVCNDVGACVGCVTADDCEQVECAVVACDEQETCVSAPEAAGEVCKDGLCDGDGVCDDVTECFVDANCPDGLCTDNNVCAECQVTTDCGEDDVCIEATCVPFAVVSIDPVNELTDVDPLTGILVGFNDTVLGLSITFNAVLDGLCTGALSLSSDGFARCAPVPSVVGPNPDELTMEPAPALSYGTAYEVQVTGIQSEAGATIAGTFESNFTTRLSGGAVGGFVVISEVYGGGGNAGAPFNHDFVELHNRGSVAVDVEGWSLQYTSSGGTTWGNNITPLAGSIPAGGYYLVQMGPLGMNGEALPTPDLIGTTSMAAVAGKVALVRSIVGLPGVACPQNPQIVDFVGYGGAANCGEGSLDGSTSTANASNTAAAQRSQQGCSDTDINNADFTIAAPAPQNTGSDPVVCFSDAVRNEGGGRDEADACRVFDPAPDPYVFNPGKSFLVFGNIHEEGFTEPNVANPFISAEVGVGPATANPQTQPQLWSWSPADFNPVCSNCDADESQYFGSVTADVVGPHLVTIRFSRDGGLSWTYCDLDRAGSDPGLRYDILDVPRISVTPE